MHSFTTEIQKETLWHTINSKLESDYNPLKTIRFLFPNMLTLLLIDFKSAC